MILAYRRLIEAVEQRRPDELGTATAARDLASGVATGIGLFALVYAILWLLGAVRFRALMGTSGVAAAFAVALASAVGEEIVFRGVVFRLLQGRLGTGAALLLSAAAFALIHAGNRGATWVSTLSVALESGVLLALAYAASRALWLPIGLHFGWNFTEGGIFGAAVSGGRYTGVIAAPLSGPALLTGGAFGPEASIAALGVCVAASAFLAWRLIRAHAWHPAPWRRSGPRSTQSSGLMRP